MALFAGSAASATNDSLLQWRQLWQQQDATNKQYDLAQQQMTFQAAQQRDQQAFQERLANAQNDFNLGVLERKELFDVSQIALDMMPNMTLDQQWSQVEALEQIGSPLVHIARNTVQASLFNNFEDAVSLVDSVFTAPLGTAFTPAFVRQAADAVISRSGMGEEEAVAFREELEAALTARQGDAEEWDNLGWETARTGLNQARANVLETQANVYNLNAQTQRIFQDTQFEADKHGFIIDSMDLQNQLMGLQVNREEMVNGNLPAQMAAELRNLNAQTKGLENGNELFNRTVEIQVQTMATQLGITQEQLRHDVATGMTRDAIVQGDLDYLRATIDYVGQQELESVARTEGLHVSAEAARLDMSNTRVSILTQLVEMGRPDLLTAVGGDLIAGLDVPEGERAQLLASLAETANSRLSNSEKVERANVQVAMAEARYAEWNADTAAERWQSDADRADRALDLQAEGLAIERTRVGAYQASLASGSVAQGARSPTSTTP